MSRGGLPPTSAGTSGPGTSTGRARQLAAAVFGELLAGLDPAARVRDALAALDGQPPGATPDATVIAVGKAAVAMAAGAAVYLGDRLRGGVVVAPEFADHQRALPAAMTRHVGSHPVPDARSEAAARALLDALDASPPGGAVLALISGGASALAALPADGLTLADKVAAIAGLHAAGVDIAGINAVRKHLSAIKGGQLAARATGPVTTLVISDVVGDDLAVVGSGPTVPDPSTYAQACEIVARAVGWSAVPRSVRAHLEAGASGKRRDTPSRPRPGDRAVLAASIDSAVDAAVAAAEAAGLRASVFARHITGDVGAAAARLAAQVRRLEAARGFGRPFCAIGAGEPTLALVPAPGVGGRAQHLALLVARDIADVEDIAVLVAGTDGTDGASDAAGAIVDGGTWDAIEAAGIDPARALARCDAGTALAAVGAGIYTGPTGVNHADIMLIVAV